MTTDLPTGVLSRQLGDLLAGRRVRTALFTTFTFDPGFFELQILPLLFQLPFRQADKVKRIQLEDALRDVDHLAVYYDQTALTGDAQPAQLDYRRIDVRRRTGAFHPKLVCMLVEEPLDDDLADTAGPERPTLSLLVGILSANLTRSGWWENVECAHFEEIPDRDRQPRRIPFRAELLRLLRRIRHAGGPADDHGALESIRAFLLRRTPKREVTNASNQGRWFTRIFHGQQRFATWLRELRLHRRTWNLEVVSPYFPETGVRPLEQLIEVLEPRQLRIHLPCDAHGIAQVPRATYDQVERLGARWSTLPAELVHRGRGANAGHQPPRFVHAKLYRLWSRDAGEVLIVGSVNLTDAAHSRGQAGNLEAAWLIDTAEQWPQRWWLRPLDVEPSQFVSESPAEESDDRHPGLDVSLRFDWGTHTLDYRLRETLPVTLRISTTSGTTLGELPAAPTDDTWQPAPPELAQAIGEHLASSSFVSADTGELEWTMLIREEHLAHRPSILNRLTPEEILEYWSLLTPEQRATLLERVAVREFGQDAQLEGLGLLADHPRRGQTLFDRFAGVFHAFSCLERAVTDALDEGRPAEAEARLFGMKYDSLPSLIEKELAPGPDTPRDPVLRYVTFLCAQQLRTRIHAEHPGFVADCGTRARRLDELLQRLPEVRAAMPVDGPRASDFLTWYEEAFLRSAPSP